jgi:hypothetical protein
VPDPRQVALSSELERVDSRLGLLQSERAQHPIAGPVVMMAVGYGTALVSSVFAIAAFAAAEDIEHRRFREYDWDYDDYDFDDNGVVNRQDERSARNFARVMTGFAGVGLGFGVAGSVLLAKRNRERNVHKREIVELKQRRRELVRSLRYGAQLNSERLDLAVSGRF